jgi:hypothetical protein
MKPRLLVAALAFGLIGHLATAQTPASHIRGSIDTLDGKILTVTTRDGAKASVILLDHARVIAFRKVDMSAITAGTFIGTAAIPGADGQLVALEVVVFNQAAHGSGAGHFDWDLAPGSSMTNGTIDAVVQGMAGRELTLSYKGGSVKVLVRPDVPVVTPIAADKSDLKPGAPVFIAPTKTVNGSLSATFVAVGKDGVAPPL